MTRRSLRTLALALPLLAGLTGIAEAQTVVKQAGFKVADMMVPFIAKEKGFFAKNGLDWQYVEIDSGKLGVAALLSGNVQFVDLGMDDIAELQAQGRDPVGFYSMINSLTMDLVLSDATLAKAQLSPAMPLDQKLKGLKGLTFGITRPGAPTQLFIQYMLRKEGFDPEKDATFVQIGGGQALVSAVKAGRIDGFLLSAPAPYLLEKDKAGTVLVKNSAGEGPAEFKDFAFETISTLKSYAAAHPEIVKSYCTSLDQAYDWIAANRDDAFKTLQPMFPDVDPATLKLSVDATFPAISPHGHLDETGVHNQLAVLKTLGAISVEPAATEGGLWTNSLCR